MLNAVSQNLLMVLPAGISCWPDGRLVDIFLQYLSSSFKDEQEAEDVPDNLKQLIKPADQRMKDGTHEQRSLSPVFPIACFI